MTNSTSRPTTSRGTGTATPRPSGRPLVPGTSRHRASEVTALVTSRSTGDMAGGADDADAQPSAPLRLVGWWDPYLAVRGVGANDPYVEQFWLPVLGPAAVLALRSLTRILARHPEGVTVELTTLARCLGLGTGLSAHRPLPRSLERLAYFDLARVEGDALGVRTHVPVLGANLLRRLPAPLRAAHDARRAETTTAARASSR